MSLDKERISKEKDKFFATVSHELRNPLNSLIGCIELLSDNASKQMHFDEISKSNFEILETAKICGETLLNLIGKKFALW